MRYLLILALTILVSAEAWAAPYWLVNGGSNGTADKSSMGIEVGGTRAIANRYPLSAELYLNFDFDTVPSEIKFNYNKFHEPYLTREEKDGPEIGYLLKSGLNLDDWVKNLTLQVGVGFALQSEIMVATGVVSGSQWQQGDRGTDLYPVGYGGLRYRLENICLSAGYNNRRGAVIGVGSSW